MLRVLMVASEAAPFAKTGGLADVAGALPVALRQQGVEAAVVMPRYAGVGLEGTRRVWDRLHVQVGRHGWHCDIHAAEHRGVTFYLVDCPALYDRPGLYNLDGRDYSDNHLRFAAFCQAAIGVARFLFRPGVFHLHDWQAATCAIYLRTRYRIDPHFLGSRIVFTIHNLEHQGRFARFQFDELGMDRSLFTPDALEFDGDLNLLKGGIAFADAITTVSPRYAEEIRTPEFGFGLDGLLRAHAAKLTGILNGADYGEWSPETDPLIAANYSAADLSGKRECKRDLLEEAGLPANNLERPVMGIVSRMARQKGFDLLGEVIWDVLHSEDAALVALGAGEERFETLFRNLAAAFPDRVGVHIGYNNRLAHKIEAGADIFLMPSLFEPCGLNQMYSLRYGTIPVVRATGGLDDSVTGETGFKFWGQAAADLLECIRAALGEFRNTEAWLARMRRAMAMDYSWDASARQYAELYRRLAGN